MLIAREKQGAKRNEDKQTFALTLGTEVVEDEQLNQGEPIKIECVLDSGITKTLKMRCITRAQHQPHWRYQMELAWTPIKLRIIVGGKMKTLTITEVEYVPDVKNILLSNRILEFKGDRIEYKSAYWSMKTMPLLPKLTRIGKYSWSVQCETGVCSMRSRFAMSARRKTTGWMYKKTNCMQFSSVPWLWTLWRYREDRWGPAFRDQVDLHSA